MAVATSDRVSMAGGEANMICQARSTFSQCPCPLRSVPKFGSATKSTVAAPCLSSDLQDRSCRINMLGEEEHEILEGRASVRYTRDEG